MNFSRNETTLVVVAVAFVCVMSTMRGMLATVTSVPLAGQALQILGLIYLARWAWTRWRPPGEWTLPPLPSWLPNSLPPLPSWPPNTAAPIKPTFSPTIKPMQTPTRGP